jgi:hypothetical protein
MNISELPKITGDVYVLGSGSSLNYIKPSFFKGKTVIGINHIHKLFPVTYGISNHTAIIQEMIDNHVLGVCPEWDMGVYGRKRANLKGNYYTFKHKNNFLYIFDERHIGYEDIDFSDFDNHESLIVGATTSSAIHLAYRIGAKNIICCGLDGGMIDGNVSIRNYHRGATNPQHIADFEPQLKIVCDYIRGKGVGVYSLNPFINFNLEGHRFENCLLDS